MPTLTDRPTGELVMLMLTATVSLLLLLSGVGLVLVTTLHPEEQSWAGDTLTALGNAVTALVAAVLGYLAGHRRSD